MSDKPANQDHAPDDLPPQQDEAADLKGGAPKTKNKVAQANYAKRTKSLPA